MIQISNSFGCVPLVHCTETEATSESASTTESTSTQFASVGGGFGGIAGDPWSGLGSYGFVGPWGGIGVGGGVCGPIIYGCGVVSIPVFGGFGGPWGGLGFDGGIWGPTIGFGGPIFGPVGFGGGIYF